MVVDIKVQRLARYRTMWETRGFSKITVDPEDVTGHQVSGISYTRSLDRRRVDCEKEKAGRG